MKLSVWNYFTKIKTRIQHMGYIYSLKADHTTTIPIVPNGFVNKQMFNTADLTQDELETILWSAIDLKKAADEQKNTNYLSSHKINALMERHNLEDDIAVNGAINMLGGKKNIIYVNKEQSDILQNKSDLAKILSLESDLILLSTNHHSNMFDIIMETTKPVINMGNNYIKPIKSLSILMTIYEKLGYLNGVNVSLIGYPCAMFNSCMVTFPKMGLNMNVSCRHGQLCRQTPRFWKTALKLSKLNKVELSQHKYIQDAISNVDIILTNEKQLNNVQLHIDTAGIVKKWYIIQNTPRPYKQKKLVEHDNKENLTLDVIENMKYLYAALMIKYLVPTYEPAIIRPNFNTTKKNVRNRINEAAEANRAFLLEKRAIIDEQRIREAAQSQKDGEDFKEAKEAKDENESTELSKEWTTNEEASMQSVVEKPKTYGIKKVTTKTLFDATDTPLLVLARQPSNSPNIDDYDKEKMENEERNRNINPSVISPYYKNRRT